MHIALVDKKYSVTLMKAGSFDNALFSIFVYDKSGKYTSRHYISNEETEKYIALLREECFTPGLDATTY